jgi:hypothetical protein
MVIEAPELLESSISRCQLSWFIGLSHFAVVAIAGMEYDCRVVGGGVAQFAVVEL